MFAKRTILVSGFWLLGFNGGVNPCLIRCLIPCLKLWVATSSAVCLIPFGALDVAADASAVDHAVAVAAENMSVFKLVEEALHQTNGGANEACELRRGDRAAADEERSTRLRIVHYAEHFYPQPTRTD